MVEDELMDNLEKWLYFNSFIYYIIMFICPLFFMMECGGGIYIASHIIYAIFAFYSVIFEIVIVLKIQKRIDNPSVLKFNKWHFVELIMGQIARFDTYLNVCLFDLLYECGHLNLAIPVGTFICINLIYPFYQMIRRHTIKVSFNHTLPKIERNCDHCFIRENMLIATVLDSFCIDNNIKICKKHISFGRTMGIWTLATQDGPQYIIHLIFMFVVHT